MKKQLLFILFIFFSPLLWRGAGGEVSAQNPLVKQWDYRFGGTSGDLLWTFLQTSDGGYILGGQSFSDSSGDKTQNSWDSLSSTGDYWIVKIDSAGNKQWDKDFGGTGDDRMYSLQQTADGGYILGGTTDSDSSGNKSQDTWHYNGSSSFDYWIVKIDSLGNKQWDKDFGGINYDQLYAVQQTADGGYILGGNSSSGITGDKTQPNWGGADYWIVKIDSLGNKQWDKDFGGTNTEELFSLKKTADGGYIFGGFSYSGISGDKTQPSWGSMDYWIIKIDSLGNKQWDKDFGGTGGDWLYSSDQTADGGYILGGHSVSNISGDKTGNNWDTLCNPVCTPDYWVIKTDAQGNKQWDKDFGGTDYEHERGRSCFQTFDKGYLITGLSFSAISGDKTENNLGPKQMWIIKTDSLGNKQWDKTIFTPGHDEGGFAVQIDESCYVFANATDGGMGGYKSQLSQGNYDYWIIKFCDSTTTTSINTNSNFQIPISIYPNPAYESLVVSGQWSGKKEIEIYDLFRRRVLKSEVKSQTSETTINISSLSPGIYFLKAGNEVRKVVKE